MSAQSPKTNGLGAGVQAGVPINSGFELMGWKTWAVASLVLAGRYFLGPWLLFWWVKR
jgi:hypothetical protein